MPLMHMKSPKAFSHNVKEEIKAGKPQKQAVAIAYSEQERASHKKHLSMGGVTGCRMCMDDGGTVQPAPGPNIDPDKAAKFIKGFQGATGFSEGGEVSDHEQEHKDLWAEKEHQHRSGQPAKAEAARSRMEALEMKHPELQGKEESYGKSEYGDEYESESPAHRMSGYAEGGEIHEDEAQDKELIGSEINDMLGEELMSAINAKDRKRIMEGIEAIVLSCMHKE